MEKTETVMNPFLAVILGFFVDPIEALICAWVTASLWLWLLTPYFGWAVPPFAGLAGGWYILTFIMGTTTRRMTLTKVNPTDLTWIRFSNQVIVNFLMPLLFLGSGWILSLLISHFH